MEPGAAAVQFRTLIDKSTQKFTLLRDLPAYGRRHWEEHFHKAFEVYSTLWKFQQDERQALMGMGLKRWEIGEIASKIGQLYYNYYLRTSDISFLSESYIFYEAIQTRGYLAGANSSPSLAVKQLRYYARFIVVCLLLNRRKMVVRLYEELDALVGDYTTILPNESAKDWQLVVQEIAAFLQADTRLRVPHGVDGGVAAELTSFRCVPLSTPPAVPSIPGVWPLRLREAILVSHKHRQVKFSELPLDTYRMLQTLELEGGAAGAGGAVVGVQGEWENPHKYLVYRPTVSRLLLVLATGCDELPPESALLLYISADGARPPPTPAQLGGRPGGGGGGGFSASMKGLRLDDSNGAGAGAGAAAANGGKAAGGGGGGGGAEPADRAGGGVHLSASSSGAVPLGDVRETCLLPEDLIPFTRRPLVVVADSDNSRAFLAMCGRERGEAAVCICSPHAQPPEMDDMEREGSLFSLFLAAPAPALCKLLGVRQPSQEAFAALQAAMDVVLPAWGDAMAASPRADAAWSRLMGDVFLRQLAVRFILCRAVLALHKDYGGRDECQPCSCPPLPPDVLPEAAAVQVGLHRLAATIGAEHLLVPIEGGGGSAGVLPTTPVEDENGAGKQWADSSGERGAQ